MLDNQKIKELALANGFKLKEQANGNLDLNAYVYDFANAIEQAVKDETHKQVALYQYEINHLAHANQLWREKAAQTIPDGFVIVPVLASEKTKQKMLKVFNESDGFLNCDNIYKAMIDEAQEQSH